VDEVSRHGANTVVLRSASARLRSLGGSSVSVFASARIDDSATPATSLSVAACNPTTSATASSSSSTSGGNAAPAAS